MCGEENHEATKPAKAGADAVHSDYVFFVASWLRSRPPRPGLVMAAGLVATDEFFDLAVQRAAFTGGLGFERESDIVHRCWGDAEKARPVVKAIREKLLAWKPDMVFTGHGVRPNGTEWVEDLLRRSEESLAKSASGVGNK